MGDKHDTVLVVDVSYMVNPEAVDMSDINLKGPVHYGDVGIDLPVFAPSDPIYIDPMSYVEVPTGVRVKIDDRCWGRIIGRSSTSFVRHVMVVEGVIDCGYTGPLYVLVFNPTNERKKLVNGDRIAQLILVPRVEYSIKRVNELPKTSRGNNGFGSTGGVIEP